MDLYSTPLTKLTYQDIDNFLQEKHPENMILEYKREESKNYERAVAAFANTDGGILFIGVEEDNKSGMPLMPAIGIDISAGLDAVKRKISSKLFDSIYPPLNLEIAVFPKDDDQTRGVALIQVQQSHETPHATDQRQRVYIRVEMQNRFQDRQAALSDWHWLWNRRENAIRLRENLINQARERVQIIINSYAKSADMTDAAILEAYLTPCFPLLQHLDVSQLLKFAKESLLGGKKMSMHNFPENPYIVRSINDGAATISYPDDKRKWHFVQSNKYGLLHSQLLLKPFNGDLEGFGRNVYGFFIKDIFSNINAFLHYVEIFINEFESLQVRPLKLNVNIKFANARDIILTEQNVIPRRMKSILETDLLLTDSEFMPKKDGDFCQDFLLICKERFLWSSDFNDLVKDH
jgi:hypothetical protein